MDKDLWCDGGGMLVIALLTDYIWPYGLALKILAFPVHMPLASASFVRQCFLRWTSGFIEVLDIAPDKERSRFALRVYVYVGTLLARRLLTLSWTGARLVAGYGREHRAAVVTLVAVIGTSLRYGPAPLKRAMNRIGREAALVWLPTGLSVAMCFASAAVYFAIVAAAWTVQHATAALASADEVLWTWAVPYLTRYAGLPPLEGFAYPCSSAPATPFDPARDIRLLKIHRKVPFLKLSAELVSYPLGSAPSPYHAISYVWADGPQDARLMLLNGRPFRVRANVLDILVRCSSFSGPRLVWIDTLCINQDDAHEKTHQVRAMRDIYARAAHVLVCLGGSSPALAPGLVAELRAVRKLLGQEHLAGYLAAFRARRRLDPYLRARVASLVGLMRHPWFSRAWVVQEAVVASRVTFFYGGAPIPWLELRGWQETICDGPVFSSLATFGWVSEESVGSSDSDFDGFLGFLSLSFTVAYRMQYAMSSPSRLGHVLRVFGEKDATEPIDKVFAFVGMAKEGNDATLKALVDYRRPAGDILLDLANYLLDTGQALQVFDLGGLRQRGRIAGLPSWAVDWTAPRVVKSVNPIFSPPGVRYRACGREPASVRRGGSREEMVVTGQVVDKIAWLAPLPETSLHQIRAAFLVGGRYPGQALGLARRHAQDPYPYSRGGQPLEEAVYRTLIGDSSASARPAPASCVDTVRTMADLLQALGTAVDAGGVFAGAYPEDVQRNLGLTAEQQREIRRATEDLTQVDYLFDKGKGCSPLIFSVTEKGYLTMVPPVSSPGDRICLIYGVDAPCVLRAAREQNGGAGAEKYQFVGDAYVHGIMDGEALDRGRKGEFILV